VQTSTPLGSPSPSSRCLTTTPLALFLSLPFSVSRCLHFFLSRALSLSLAPCPGGARLPCMAAEHLCAPTRTSSASVSLPSHPAAASTPVPPTHTLSPSLSASLSLCLRLCLPPPLPLCVFWQGLRALLEADASPEARMTPRCTRQASGKKAKFRSNIHRPTLQASAVVFQHTRDRDQETTGSRRGERADCYSAPLSALQ
jgi:hypothetical protein